MWTSPFFAYRISRSIAARLPREADVDLAFDVSPLLGRSESLQELVERFRVLRCELEPGEEVERLAEVSRVVEAPGDRRKIVEPDRDVVRRLLEDRPSLILGQRPPFVGLTDRDQRGACGFGSAERFLPRRELLVLCA